MIDDKGLENDVKKLIRCHFNWELLYYRIVEKL